MHNAVIFHVGGPKTGSSAIQAFLDSNEQFLIEHGLTYPKNNGSNSAPLASRGLRRGNGVLWSSEPESLDLIAGELWSSESLFTSKRFQQELQRKAHGTNLKIIVCGYFRNPISWARSQWMQKLKTGGSSMNFEEFLESGRPLRRFEDLLDWLENFNSDVFMPKFSNFDNHKEHLTQHFSTNCLGIAVSELKHNLRQTTFNRSLTEAEVAVFRQINKVSGRKGLSRSLSSNLITQFPELKSFRPTASNAVIENYLEECIPAVTKINDLVPESEAISLSVEEDTNVSNKEDECLPIEWFEILGRTLALQPLPLHPQSVDTIRDIAAKIQDGNKVGPSESLALLRIAEAQRPNGLEIRRRISKLLNADEQ